MSLSQSYHTVYDYVYRDVASVSQDRFRAKLDSASCDKDSLCVFRTIRVNEIDIYRLSFVYKDALMKCNAICEYLSHRSCEMRINKIITSYPRRKDSMIYLNYAIGKIKAVVER